MAERILLLDDVSPLEFLGTENKIIKELSAVFPKSRIVARGDEIKIIGSEDETIKIMDLIQSLKDHFHRFGQITHESLEMILKEEEILNTPLSDGVILYGDRGIVIKPKTENHKKLVASAIENDLVFAVGPAGTGKTYISVAIAVRALKNQTVRKIIITRPAVEAGENLGFLPGDLKEKLDPYLRPIYDALEDMIPRTKLKQYMDNNIIEIAPLAYMRGRTLGNAFVLLDEAQNTTPMQMKMFLTRMGNNSKMIITGDKTQIDLPGRQKSGLTNALETLQGIKGIGIVILDDKDVMRHQLVGRIIGAYQKAEDTQSTS
ncbi:MAG: PhoH family protein [Cytophagales bacterium]|nr:MAG: PhoH family protein [Cytophagales bacterium]